MPKIRKFGSKITAPMVAMLLPIACLSETNAQLESMAYGLNGYTVSPPLFTVGESINGYTPPGVLDGMGAFKLNRNTVRLLVNHELLNFRGYAYETAGFSLMGARVSYFICLLLTISADFRLRFR